MNNDPLLEQLGRLKRVGLTVGLIGMAVWLLGGVLSLVFAFQRNEPEAAEYFVQTFFSAYLIAYLFWFGVTAGSLALLMLHHTVGGGWGFVIRRLLEAGSRLVPLAALGFLPIAVSLFVPGSPLFWWARAGNEDDHIWQAQSPYLNVPFFLIRAVLYFVILGWLARTLNVGSLRQDREDDPKVYDRLTNFSAAGMLIYVLIMTFAIVDWVMSLTAHWFSSIIGLLFVVGQGLSTFALMHNLVSRMGRNSDALRKVPSGYFRDLGNLTLAFVLLWAYASFSQFLIYYSGNTAETAHWYVQRTTQGWQYLGTVLIFAHFFLPFLVLLVASGVKRDVNRLAKVGMFLIAMRFIDLFWWIAPSFHESVMGTLPGVWVYIAAPIGMGGVWLSLWATQMLNHLKDRPLLPLYDPRADRDWVIDKEKPAAAPVVGNGVGTANVQGEVQHG
jgi:hypothetical protein